MCFKQTANLLSLRTHVCRHVVRSSFARSSYLLLILLIISSRDCREADSRDTSPRHACLGEVSRKIWLHDLPSITMEVAFQLYSLHWLGYITGIHSNVVVFPLLSEFSVCKLEFWRRFDACKMSAKIHLREY